MGLIDRPGVVLALPALLALWRSAKADGAEKHEPGAQSHCQAAGKPDRRLAAMTPLIAFALAACAFFLGAPIPGLILLGAGMLAAAGEA